MGGGEKPVGVEAMTDRIGDVHLGRGGHVASITIRKPPNNSVSVELMRDLADALEGLANEPDVRAVVLASEGKIFCAGADLSQRIAGEGLGRANTNPLYDQAVRLYAQELPIVAAIQGAAVGAGLGLALVADFRVAAGEARFAANFTKLGFHPGFGLTHTLPRLVGAQAAAHMFLSGERLDASAALRIGLVDEVTDLSNLLPAAHALAAKIAENAPLAVRSTRKTLRADLAAAVRIATDHEFAEQQWLMKTDDFEEGVKSVAERRPGRFNGR
jgi:enoyl-CoA hydratase/carnithine racemase